MKKTNIQYLDGVRLIQDWKGYGRKYKEGSVGQVFNSPTSSNIFVKFGMDDGVFIPSGLLERAFDVRSFRDIGDIWDEEVQPISEAEMLQVLYESREDLSIEHDIYIVAIYTNSRNKEDGWDDDEQEVQEDREDREDIQPWEICTTTMYYVQNGTIKSKESLSHSGLVYSEVYNIDNIISGRSFYSIVRMIHNGMEITTKEIRQLYEGIGIL